MKLSDIFKIMAVRYVSIGLLGLFLGWLIFGSPTKMDKTNEHKHETATDQIWTCSMHPQIREKQAGKCPICGMELIPLENASTMNMDADEIHMSTEAMALADVETSKVSRQNPTKSVQLYGTIQPNEQNLQSQTATIAGRIEQLMVDVTGQHVVRGQTLATIYSPDLYNAQQELLEAVKMKDAQPQLLAAAREKLRLWKLTDEQISKIENSGIASPTFQIKATTNGVVMSKKVNRGNYVKEGDVLFDIADLSSVWAVFDAFESDLPFLKIGNPIQFTLQALPGKTYSSKITFVDPVIDKVSRTARIRVQIANPNGDLKPEMYASATINATMKQHQDQFIIPQTAILWTGTRSIVYVKDSNSDEPMFKMREIELGPYLGNSYVVLKGLSDGETIVTNGVFSIDASAQLEGKKSMMNQK